MNQFKAYVMVTRPPNGILMFIGILAGVALSYSKIIRLEELVYSFIVAYTLNGSSMVLNDYFDREIDKINAPHRPLASGLIKPSHAILYSIILALIGITFAALISSYCMIIAIISYIVAFLYNSSWKKSGLTGNFIVSLVVSAPFIFGATMSDGYISERIMIFIIPVILSNTGREIIKGIADIEGDAIRDVKSIARIKGADKAALMGAIFYISAVLFSPIPYFMGLVSQAYLPIVLMADAGFIQCSIKIIKSPSRENAIKVKNETLGWMLVALIAYIIGGIL